MSKTATLIGRAAGSMAGDARHYRLSEPLEGNEHVVVSAVEHYFGFTPIIETYIFPADEKGKVIGWGELPGSFQGDTNHEKALSRAGYEVSK
jgi:hypothetical protein